MRIPSVLQVVISDRPYGAARVAFSLTKHLHELTEVSVMVNEDIKSLFEQLDGVRVDVLPIRFHGKWKSPTTSPSTLFQYLESYLRLNRAAESFSADIVHLHLPNAYLLSFGNFGKSAKMLTIHGPMFESSARFFEDILVRIGPLKTGRLTAVKPNIAAEFELRTGRKVEVVENGVDSEEIERLAAGSDSDYNDVIALRNKGFRIVVSVGRLERRKGQMQLLKAVESLRKKKEKILFFFVGDGPDMSELERYAADNSLKDDVIFLGFKENPYPFYSAADVVVGTLSPTLKGADLVELEPLALGKKVLVGFDQEKSSRLGETVTYCDSNSPTDIAEKLNFLLNAQPTSANSELQELLQRSSWSNVCRRYISIYESMVSKSKDVTR
jgi:glycosyltransferase involved in cell wall biosynthesis